LGLGAEDLRARVSDRILLAELLQGLGVRPDRLGAAFAVIDKIERESGEKTTQRLCDPKEVGLSEPEAARILALFQAPGLEEVAAVCAEIPAAGARLGEIRRFLAVLDDLGFSDFVEFDLRIVRGLAYYTGIVFEVFDRKGEFRAICGGGRYDSLLEKTGGESLPAVGFGMGGVVRSELLKERGLAPDYRREVDYYIIAVEESLLPMARRIAAFLRAEGHRIVHSLRPHSMKKQFSAAAVEGAKSVIILGPDEVGRGVAKVRDMQGGQETEVRLDRWLGTATDE
jgi:histidyl-tRNA synthetase